jgi:hypothetical protein
MQLLKIIFLGRISSTDRWIITCSRWIFIYQQLKFDPERWYLSKRDEYHPKLLINDFFCILYEIFICDGQLILSKKLGTISHIIHPKEFSKKIISFCIWSKYHPYLTIIYISFFNRKFSSFYFFSKLKILTDLWKTSFWAEK